jgi:deoxycytidylate deaminase
LFFLIIILLKKLETIPLEKSLLKKMINIAKKSTMKSKHAACLIFKGKILSMSFNFINKKIKHNDFLNLRNQTFNKNNKNKNIFLSFHAEEKAIRDFLRFEKKRYRSISKNLILIVIRIDKKNNLVDSKPCTHCVEVMKNLGIKKVIYSQKDGSLTMERLSKINSIPSSGYKSIEKLKYNEKLNSTERFNLI